MRPTVREGPGMARTLKKHFVSPALDRRGKKCAEERNAKRKAKTEATPTVREGPGMAQLLFNTLRLSSLGLQRGYTLDYE